MIATREDTTPTPEQYAVMAQQGQEEGWTYILNFCREISRTPWIARGSREFKEEVVSETMVKLLGGAIGRYNSSRPLKPWITAIMRNVTTDLHRKEYRSRRKVRGGTLSLDRKISKGGPDYLSLFIDEYTSDPERAIEKEEEESLARDAMESLPEARRAVVMRKYGGPTINQIANEMGIPTGTVKSRLNGGLTELRKLLREDHPEEFPTNYSPAA